MAAANRGKAKAQQKEQLSLDRNLKNDQLRDESALAHYENN